MGNSFLRSFIENVTGIHTGADMNVNLTCHMQTAGLAGEDIQCDSGLVWITKTHWPMESPFGAAKYTASKAFVIVRNPMDSLVSIANLALTGTHSQTVNETLYSFPAFWKPFVE